MGTLEDAHAGITIFFENYYPKQVEAAYQRCLTMDLDNFEKGIFWSRDIAPRVPPRTGILFGARKKK